MSLSAAGLILFGLISIAHLSFEAVHAEAGRLATKPLLMPALLLYYMASAHAPNIFLMAALFCGWLGDIFLMLPDQRPSRLFFKLGLGAFLLGHVFYIAVFVPYLVCAGHLPAWGWMVLCVFGAASLMGYRLIAPHAQGLRPVILAYILVIFLMGASAVFPLGSASMSGALMVVIGAFVFMLSDGINACNRFIRAVPYEGLLIMATYVIGQYLLVQGYLLF